MGRGLFELTIKSGRVKVWRGQLMVDHKDAKDLADAVKDALKDIGRDDANDVHVEVRKADGAWVKDVKIQ